METKAELDQTIIKKQNERKETLKKLKEENPVNDEAQNILKFGDEELIFKLQNKELKAADVLRAYLAKAIEVTEACNCVTEFIPQAKGWADELDSLEEVKGPLHGIPIALKDDYDVEGMDSTLGYAKWLYRPKGETGVLVKILQDLGAIPFCKTNVPQSLFAWACDNPIFGKTLNPKNIKLSPGGSSGGSGAILGAGGAVFATGSDIGGSLRIPSHFNGVCTVRSTLKRLSGKGVVQCIPKLVGFVGVPGIMARNVKTLSMVMKELLTDNRQNDLDPLTIPIPWNEEIFSSTKKLRIGFFTSLPFFPALGDTPKTVLEAKTALECLGHTLVPFEMPDSFHYMGVINSLICADGGKNIREMFLNEQIAPAVKGFVTMSSTAEWKRKLAASFFSGQGSKRLQMMTKCELIARNSEDLWGKMWERQLIIEDMVKRIGDANLDLLLTPVFPFPAIKVDDAALLLWAVVYTFIWNLVDFPAGVLRFGTESGELIEEYDDEGDVLLKLGKESCKESKGMPIGVQLVARPFKEELVLRVMSELEKVAQNK